MTSTSKINFFLSRQSTVKILLPLCCRIYLILALCLENILLEPQFCTLLFSTMASSEELSGLNTGYHESKKGPPRLTIYELYQVEQYESQELFEFEQYVKIIRFAEAVCSGTHSRFGVFPQPDLGGHIMVNTGHIRVL